MLSKDEKTVKVKKFKCEKELVSLKKLTLAWWAYACCCYTNVPSLFPSSCLLYSVTLPYGVLCIAEKGCDLDFCDSYLGNWGGSGLRENNFKKFEIVSWIYLQCVREVGRVKKIILRRVVDTVIFERNRERTQAILNLFFPWRLGTMWDVLLIGFKQVRCLQRFSFCFLKFTVFVKITMVTP